MKYKDDLDEANHKIDQLTKHLNVTEKYRKKLESMGDLEQQMKIMEEQHARMSKELRAAEESAKQVPGLKRTVEQYKKQVTRLENDCAEMSRTKHSLESEKQILLSRSDGAEYQKTKDQERIRNLEEKIRELESGLVSEAAEEYGGDLGSELAYSTRTKADMCVLTDFNQAMLVADDILGNSRSPVWRRRSDISRTAAVSALTTSSCNTCSRTPQEHGTNSNTTTWRLIWPS